MTQNEWMQSVRKRTHDLANKLQGLIEEMIVLREQCAEIKRRADLIEPLEEAVRRLEHQAQVLRWLLGVATAVLVGVALRFI